MIAKSGFVEKNVLIGEKHALVRKNELGRESEFSEKHVFVRKSWLVGKSGFVEKHVIVRKSGLGGGT